MFDAAGSEPGCPSDLDCDCDVDVFDLEALLAVYGTTCQ